MVRTVCDSCEQLRLCEVDEDGVALCEDCLRLQPCIVCNEVPCRCNPAAVRRMAEDTDG